MKPRCLPVWRTREGRNWPAVGHRLLLQACLGADRSAVAAWEDWRRRVDFDRIDVGSRRMIPLLYHNLSRLGVSDPMLARYKGVYLYYWLKNQWLRQGLTEAIQAFDQAGIPVLLLKGSALAQLYYPEPGLRPMNDCDILVHQARAVESIRLLFDLGWISADGLSCRGVEASVLAGQCHDFSNSHQGAVDLHWHPLHTPAPAAADDLFWAKTQPLRLPNVETRTLDATEHLLHACEHGVRWDFVPSLRWVADATMILRDRTRPIDWDRLLEHVRVRRLSVIVENALGYLQRHFDAPLPENILTALRSLPKASFEGSEFRALTSPGWLSVQRSGNWYRFRRWHGAATAPRRRAAPVAFVRYLQSRWGLATRGQIPGYILKKLSRKFSRELKRIPSRLTGSMG